MTFLKGQTGKLGENLAKNFLKAKGYRILEQNFRSTLGEIDLITKKDQTLHFIEVKTRIGLSKGFPYEAVNSRKRGHLIRSLQVYQKKNKLKDEKLSLDVISIVLNQDQSVNKLDFYESITV